jgi:hypothetical protein
VIVVDSGRASFGARFAKAKQLAVQIARDMDRRDRATVFACDVECKRMPHGFAVPGAAFAKDVEAFLAGISPDGATDLGGAVKEALAYEPNGERERRVFVLSSGLGTVGARSAELLGRQFAGSFRNRDTQGSYDHGQGAEQARGRVVTLGLGSDADAGFLSDMAYAGGGTYLPVDGRSSLRGVVGEALRASYGSLLSQLTVELPDGLGDVAPKRLLAVGSGGEVTVAAKMLSEHVAGDMVVRGKVGREPFEKRIPLDLTRSADDATRWISRVYAGMRVADLDRDSSSGAKAESIALSRRFRVPSKYTSLLVLESEAMFRSFGIERTTSLPVWTGESTGEANAVGDVSSETQEARKEEGGARAMAKTTAPSANAGSGALAGGASDKKAGPAAEPDAAWAAQHGASAQPAPRPASPPAEARRLDRDLDLADDGVFNEAPRRRVAPPGRYMKRIWVRVASVSPWSNKGNSQGSSQSDDATLDTLRDAAASAPDDRNKRAALSRKFASLGRVEDLERELARWEERDPFDTELLELRAEASFMRGDDREAERRLSGIVASSSVSAADSKKLLDRLARALRRNTKLACAIRTTAAEWKSDRVGAERALVCASDVDQPRASGTSITGDVRVTATANEGDVDLVIVDADGHRIGTGTAAADGLTWSRGGDTLSVGVSAPKTGKLFVEVRRRTGPARGKVTVTSLGASRTLDYDLDSQPEVRVATVTTSYQPQLVPMEQPAPTWWRQ